MTPMILEVDVKSKYQLPQAVIVMGGYGPTLMLPVRSCTLVHVGFTLEHLGLLLEAVTTTGAGDGPGGTASMPPVAPGLGAMDPTGTGVGPKGRTNPVQKSISVIPAGWLPGVLVGDVNPPSAIVPTGE